MKKFRFLLALAVVVTMISTVAMAADSVIVKDATDTNISYESGNLTIEVVATDNYSAIAPTFELYYDSSKWEPTEISSSITGADCIKTNANIDGNPSTVGKQSDVEIVKNDVVMKVVYSPVSGADVKDSTFKLYSYWMDSSSYDEIITDNTVYTVKAAQTEETVAAKVESEGKETVNGKDNSYWGLWVGRYSVVPGTKTLKSAVVSFADTDKTFPVTFGEIEASGEGKVEFAVAIFGVPDTHVTGKSSAVVTLQ